MTKQKTKAESKSVTPAEDRAPLEQFLAENDPKVKLPTKIRAGLDSLRAERGRYGWEYENAFLKRCPGVGNMHLAALRKQFDAHIIMTRPDGRNEKRAWWADAEAAAEARAELAKSLGAGSR